MKHLINQVLIAILFCIVFIGCKDKDPVINAPDSIEDSKWEITEGFLISQAYFNDGYKYFVIEDGQLYLRNDTFYHIKNEEENWGGTTINLDVEYKKPNITIKQLFHPESSWFIGSIEDKIMTTYREDSQVCRARRYR